MISSVVEVVRVVLFAVAHILGGSMGGAIVVVSLLVRLALLPLTLRLARRGLAQQAILESLRPQVERLKHRYLRQPDRLASETLALYRRAGYRPLSLSTLLGTLVQLPIVAGVYGAVRSGSAAGARFLWVRDLARADAVLAIGVAALTGLVTYLSGEAGSTAARPLAPQLLFGTVLTVFVMWRFSAALVLSWGASAVGNLLQASVLARRSASQLRPGSA